MEDNRKVAIKPSTGLFCCFSLIRVLDSTSGDSGTCRSRNDVDAILQHRRLSQNRTPVGNSCCNIGQKGGSLRRCGNACCHFMKSAHYWTLLALGCRKVRGGFGDLIETRLLAPTTIGACIIQPDLCSPTAIGKVIACCGTSRWLK